MQTGTGNGADNARPTLTQFVVCQIAFCGLTPWMAAHTPVVAVSDRSGQAEDLRAKPMG
jgi:hypothetical protein